MEEQDDEKKRHWTRQEKAESQCHFMRGGGVGGWAVKEVGSSGWEEMEAKSFITRSFPPLLPILFIRGHS